jgi:hypothetical protein
MGFQKELGLLVIRNMDIIETIPEVVRDVEKRFFTAINKRVKDCVPNDHGCWHHPRR